MGADAGNRRLTVVPCGQGLIQCDLDKPRRTVRLKLADQIHIRRDGAEHRSGQHIDLGGADLGLDEERQAELRQVREFRQRSSLAIR